ncbi:hypothetical protein [Burkholderia gladioli]|uniref:hypothetical protein n=1 Tax=Burkholderia gladioli TaxID=28095 RepID=UPI001641638C|nr:hypothetical protein [Burkholderia gladioli]
MKRPWDPITLRVESWNAAHQPEGGDELRTTRGRRYQILEVCRRGARITALKCMVLPVDAVEEGRLFLWTWGGR